MGRSVDYASGAGAVVYVDVSYIQDSWEWDDFVDDVQSIVKDAYKSFDNEDKWIGRELRAILENRFAQVVVSEYCGLASISLVAKEYDCYYSDEISLQNLAHAWVNRIAPNFEKVLNKAFNCYAKIGSFSNGEGVYEKIAA